MKDGPSSTALARFDSDDLLTLANDPSFVTDRAIRSVFAKAHSRDLVVLAAECLGGVSRLVEWVQEDAENERDYWTKIFPRTIQRDVEVTTTKSFDELVFSLAREAGVIDVSDATDAEFVDVASAAEPRPKPLPEIRLPVDELDDD